MASQRCASCYVRVRSHLARSDRVLIVTCVSEVIWHFQIPSQRCDSCYVRVRNLLARSDRLLVVTCVSEVIWHVQIHAKLSEYLHRSGCRNTPESSLLPGSIHVRWIFVLFSENIAAFALRMVPRAIALISSPLRLSSHSRL